MHVKAAYSMAENLHATKENGALGQRHDAGVSQSSEGTTRERKYLRNASYVQEEGQCVSRVTPFAVWCIFVCAKKEMYGMQ